jgi:hypothetical protein
MRDIARQLVTIALLVLLVVGGAICAAATSPSTVVLPASHPTAVPDPHPGAVQLMKENKRHEQGVRPTAGWASVVTVLCYLGAITAARRS